MSLETKQKFLDLEYKDSFVEKKETRSQSESEARIEDGKPLVSPEHSRCSHSVQTAEIDDEDIDDTSKDKNVKTCCKKIRLRQGVSRTNVASFMAGSGTGLFLMNLQTTFCSYLLEDHFGIEDDDKAAAILGQIGLVGDCGSVSAEFLLGYVMDAIGRKWPAAIGLAISGAAFIAKPLPSHLYGLYILRVIGNIGVLPINYSPLSADYIYKEDLGKLESMMAIVAYFSGLFSTTVAIQVEKFFNAQVMYYASGTLAILVALV